MPKTLEHQVSTMKAAGLQAYWYKTVLNGRVIRVRNPQSGLQESYQWRVVDRVMWRAMVNYGVMEGFKRVTG